MTGKGILELQTHGVDVRLFPHRLAEEIRALNAEFIRTQNRLGATILSPLNGESLHTYKTGGKHVVRIECLNPPTADNYLVVYRGGLCWPQGGSFRQVAKNTWEIDLHFGTTGEHDLHIVTANASRQCSG